MVWVFHCSEPLVTGPCLPKGAEAQPSLGCAGAGGRQQTATRPNKFSVRGLCLCDNKPLWNQHHITYADISQYIFTVRKGAGSLTPCLQALLVCTVESRFNRRSKSPTLGGIRYRVFQISWFPQLGLHPHWGFVAGSCAGLATTPLDAAKTRIMLTVPWSLVGWAMHVQLIEQPWPHWTIMTLRVLVSNNSCLQAACQICKVMLVFGFVWELVFLGELQILICFCWRYTH